MMSDNFMVPDGCGGWRFPDEKPQKVTYSAGTTQHISDTEMCSCNRSRGYEELQERYEQLELVAKDLYSILWHRIFTRTGNLHGEIVRKNAADRELRNYRDALEALGVSLDD